MPADVSVRVDKWLQIARVFKTRSRATRACTLSNVRVNGQVAKPHKVLQVDDRVEVEIGDWTRVLVVRELATRTMPKKLVPRIYEDKSPPRREKDPFDWMRERPVVRRERGSGRPTKRDRRDMERFIEPD